MIKKILKFLFPTFFKNKYEEDNYYQFKSYEESQKFLNSISKSDMKKFLNLYKTKF
jgi:hypothetical protein